MGLAVYEGAWIDKAKVSLMAGACSHGGAIVAMYLLARPKKNVEHTRRSTMDWYACAQTVQSRWYNTLPRVLVKRTGYAEQSRAEQSRQRLGKALLTDTASLLAADSSSYIIGMLVRQVAATCTAIRFSRDLE